MNIWSLTDLAFASPQMGYRDIIWGYLNQRSNSLADKKDYGLYRNCRYRMHTFLKEEGRIKDAFKILCEVVAYDLSGLSNNFDMSYIKIIGDNFFPYSKSIVKLAPAITGEIKEYAQNFSLSDEQLMEQIVSMMERERLPFDLFTSTEKAQIVLAEINQDSELLEQVYNNAEKRFRKQYMK